MSLHHLMIRASAGSGKTYALTNRFVELLAAGAPPEKIVALTFTRKAAGEFFDEILRKLARAGEDAKFARTLAAEIGQPGLGRPEFVGMLRQVIDAMPQLRLGTLDGFFARIARSFPLELGLAGSFELIEGHGAHLQRLRVLQRLFARGVTLDAAQREFVEAFKRATYGREEKRLGLQLEAFLDEHQENFLAVPEAEFWGNAARIWPAGNSWLEARPDPQAALAVLRRWVEANVPAGRLLERWQDFMAAVEIWRPGAPAPRALEYFLEKAIPAWDDLRKGRAVLTFDRKAQEVAGDAATALAMVTAHVVGGEFTRRLEMTRGIHAVLRGYEAVYDARVRREGKLTFADVQRLLLPEGKRQLTGDAARAGDRLFLDYRLDGQIDHWLLDEFQDTSAAQWSILKNLVDEAVQDPEGARTFFCVGDVKQAIYTWRGGDPRLFQEVLDHYNRTAPGTILEDKLAQSWRSVPAVIAMVNRVFGDMTVIRELFSESVVEMWTREWKEHTSAPPARTGQSAVIFGDDESGRWQQMVAVLKEIRPSERGLSCAVLVQKNSTATRIADFLRKNELAALAESDLQVCTDNPVGAAFLALVQAAVHPGDTLAWHHVGMTPFASVLSAARVQTAGQLAERILAQIHWQGFERTADAWLSRLPDSKADVFTALRIRQMVEAARIFDQSGSRDGDEFIAFMRRYTVRDAADPAAVRVMTIHKSKGLGFDVVLLPDLEGKKLDSRRKGLAVGRTSGGEADWVLDLPSELFRDADPVLSRYVRGAEAEAGYAALALLYVGLTRAKRGMYVFVEPALGSKSLNYPRVLANTLGESRQPITVGAAVFNGPWVEGDGQWFATEPKVGSELDLMPVALGTQLVERMPRALRLPGRRPSEGKAHVGRVSPLLSMGSTAGREFGSEVHRLLADVEWLLPAELPGRERRWEMDYSSDAVRAARQVLDAGALEGLWQRQSAQANEEVWREKAFELVLDGKWYTGAFDRVVIRRDGAGNAISAWVVDFKTDRLSNGNTLAQIVERHREQLRLYQRVASVLLDIRVTQVRTSLVLLSEGAVSVAEVGSA